MLIASLLLAPVRGAVCRAHGRVDGLGPVELDLLVIQIDGLHIGSDLVLVAALGIDGEGNKHPPGLIEGATENATAVQALI